MGVVLADGEKTAEIHDCQECTNDKQPNRSFQTKQSIAANLFVRGHPRMME
ncbi:hypothetical protein GRI89_10595 [Altererythrobacter salegens]|uniref:Uncharacterized protein n=1 Tax=Croceibacterium salegens TaxID=1737568 RepID=A0A6I4SX22_9SPHN|nr:hypothetical protein [Croceibacterium salegens]MXO59988.1 hypothetical protein [Croceibacterium salegens]